MSKIASQKRGIHRLLRKLVLSFACNVSWIPSKRVRPWLCRFAGVNIQDPSSVFIGEGVRFDSISPENISIGRNVRITSGACILNHFFDAKFQPTKERPFQFLNGNIVIGDNVFIGVNTVICKPVTIGDYAVVGAGSIVVKDVQPHSIVGGNPAKVIGVYGNEIS